MKGLYLYHQTVISIPLILGKRRRPVMPNLNSTSNNKLEFNFSSIINLSNKIRFILIINSIKNGVRHLLLDPTLQLHSC